MKSGSYLLLAAVITAVGASFPTLAHDLNGLLVPRTLPENVRNDIEARERLRNPANARLASAQLDPQERANAVRALGVPAKYETLEGIFNALAVWPKKSKLAFCFFDGTPKAQKTVIALAESIAKETNLKLDTVVRQCPYKSAQIRVSFRQAGFWSYVGTDALLIPSRSPTMGLQNLDLVPMNDEAMGTIRHELMHAFGALHEHQHPDTNCDKQLNWKAVQKALGWDDQEMETNFRQIVFGSGYVKNAYDKKSIMHYQLPEYFWVDGTKSSCFLESQNQLLSPGDVEIVRRLYPRN